MKCFVLTLLPVVVLADAPFDVVVVVVVVAKAKSALVLLTELHWFPKDNRKNNVTVISRNPFFNRFQLKESVTATMFSAPFYTYKHIRNN